MKRIALAAMAVCLLSGTSALAQPLHPIGGGHPGGFPGGRPGGFPGGHPGYPGGPGHWGGPRHWGGPGWGWNPVGFHRWGYGAYLPRAFFAPEFFVTDYAYYNLTPPPADFQWVRNGDDALLVNLDTGMVVNVVYGAFA